VRVYHHRKSGKFKLGFEATILFVGTEAECVAQEIGYRPRPGMGWNTYSGGKIGRKPHASTLEKNSLANLGKKRTDATKELIGAVRRGKHRDDLTPESRAAIASKLTGRKASEETRAKQSQTHKDQWASGKRVISERGKSSIRVALIGNQFGRGTVFSDKEIERRRQRALGNNYGHRERSPQECANISAGLKGKSKSTEHRASISAAKRRRDAANPPDHELKRMKQRARRGVVALKRVLEKMRACV